MSSEQPDTEKADLQPLSRRETLGLAGMCLVGGLAGCSSSDPGSGSSTPTPGVTAQSSPFTTISFEGQDMVVELPDSHDVQRVNLIAPDGTLYTQKSVATGVSTIRLQILDFGPEVSGYEHYDPGVYELAAVTENETRSQTVELRPDLTVTNVESSVYEGSRGYLAVTLENRGTTPTWPYQIAYRDAPYFVANTELNDFPGIPTFLNTERTQEILLEPGESQAFIGQLPPLTFENSEANACTGTTVEFDVLVGRPAKPPLERRVRATLSGDERVDSSGDTHTCSETAVQLIDGGRDDE